MSDLKLAVRGFLTHSGFSAVVLLTLGLGIGGSTAIFSVVNGVLLRPLPYPDPDRLVSVRAVRAGMRETEVAHSAADFLDLVREQQVFTDIAGYREDVVAVAFEGGDTSPLDGALVTAAFFDVFGVPPARGRTFTPADQGDARLLVASDGAWRRHFGADPGAVGRTVRANGQPYTLVGVMPAGFDWPRGTEAWALSDQPVPTSPVAVEGSLLENREIGYFFALARIRPGLSLGLAEGHAAEIARRIGERHARSAGRSYSLLPIREQLLGDVRQGLVLLLAAVGCVLLIACANVAGLLVARGVGRQRELGIRTAMGASRARIVRQLLIESALLAAAGGAVGLLLAAWSLDALVALIPDTIPRLSDVRLDARVALFAVAVSVLTGVLSGLAPAIQTSSVNVIELLRDGGRAAGSYRTRRLRGMLVAGEVALALVLLVVAGLMINSFVRLRAVHPGYALEQAVGVDIALPTSVYGTPERQSGFYSELLERLQSSPATRTSGLVFPRPFSQSGGQTTFEIEGAPPAPGEGERHRVQLSIASPGVFAALGVPLLAGRTFTAADVKDAPAVVIVDRSLADRHWPGESPVGRRITFDRRADTPDPKWAAVVGVVGDTRPRALDVRPQPTVYFPYQQFSLPFTALVVRGTLDPASAAREIRAHLRAVDPAIPVNEVRTLGDLAARTTEQPRFRTFILTGFAAVSLVLTATALYGLLSYSVAQRRREVGVRMALGATPRDVLRLVVGEGMSLVALGAAAGVAGAAAAARLVGALLYDVSATDPATYAVVIGLLSAVAFGACYLPAARAARVNPMAALRAE